MEAIKKKMQAMKVEKDNLMDRCDACEQVELRKYLYHFDWKLFSTVLSRRQAEEREDWRRGQRASKQIKNFGGKWLGYIYYFDYNHKDEWDWEMTIMNWQGHYSNSLDWD